MAKRNRAIISIDPETVQGSIHTRDFGYEYPEGLDLKPGSKLHERIRSRVMQRAQASHDAMAPRHRTWNKIDEMLTAYIPLSGAEKRVKEKDVTKPVSIIVPYSYANLETILAYQTKAFLGSPIYQYEGVGPEDIIGAKLLEIVVNQQARRYKHGLALHTGFRDGLAYGLHASYVPWHTKNGKKVQVTETPIFDTAGAQTGIDKTKENVSTILFEGNKLKNIDPYKYLPDIKVSAENMQDGEFVGWFEEENIFNLLSEEAEGGLFNVKYVRDAIRQRTMTSVFSGDNSKRDKFNIKQSESLHKGDDTSVIVVPMYMTIIPKDWGLEKMAEGNGRSPEKFFFLLANDSIVIDARPLGLNHNMYPLAVNAPDFDGYSVSPISRLEMSYGLQEVLNWVFNSHVANVRKAINDMFVVDPSLINMEDMANPEAGKLIRLRRAAWGRGVEGAVKQFGVNDITKNHIATDAPFVMDLMQKVNASSDAAMGVMKGGERRSAAEFNGTMGSLISRLEHLSSITSMQYLQDIGYLCASHTQQLMEKNVYVRAVGSWPEELAKEYGKSGVDIDPYAIVADFDVIFKDGSSGNVDAETLTFWSQMFPQIANDPRFDGQKIFQHIARLSGAKDVGSFLNRPEDQVQVQSDEGIRAEAAAGNLIPASDVEVAE